VIKILKPNKFNIKTSKELTLQIIKEEKYKDNITDLPNRKKFDSFFKTKEQLDDQYLVIFKVENFEFILNEYGNSRLEEFIKNLSIIFKEFTFDDEQLFHLRDNTFAVLLSGYNPINFKNRIKKLDQEISLKDLLTYPELSIGISKFIDTRENLFRNSEAARAYAKKNLFRFFYFNNNIDKLNRKKLTILNDLANALKNNEFILYLQPKVNLKTKKIDSAEVLIRWEHPKEGFIPPDLFMPYMENMNLINEFTFWLIEETLKLQNKWKEEQFYMKLAINTPVACLRDRSIIEHLETSHDDLNGLEFEVLERHLIDDFKEVSSIMIQLKKLGISFALDDFGTEFATISYLKNLPFDKVKIDRMFVDNMTTDKKDFNLVNYSILLAKSIGLETIAEGVEDIETFNLLSELGCDYSQGYLTSKPLNTVSFKSFCVDYNNKI
jgi:EAL domain-containing protein (putative c-di-GMP-specific phosphodiesterase class I)/GGDEF domain-containing protein